VNRLVRRGATEVLKALSCARIGSMPQRGGSRASAAQVRQDPPANVHPIRRCRAPRSAWNRSARDAVGAPWYIFEAYKSLSCRENRGHDRTGGRQRNPLRRRRKAAAADSSRATRKAPKLPKTRPVLDSGRSRARSAHEI